MTTANERDTTPDAEKRDTPKIAEKVRFWEEQDRINQELIPRIIKQHELFSAHVEGHEDVRVQMAALDARISDTVDEAVKQAVAASGKKMEALEEQVAETLEESSKSMSKLEGRTALAIMSTKRQARIISGISLAIAVTSLIVAVVS